MLGTRLVCLLMPDIGGGRGRQGLLHKWSLPSTPVLLCFSSHPVLLSFPTSAMASPLESLLALGSAVGGAV